MEQLTTRAAELIVTKVNDDDSLVYGWAIVSTVGGEKYYDLQGHHITETAVIKSSSRFMTTLRVGKDMHAGKKQADIVHSMPMTSEIAKAFYPGELGEQIAKYKTGWMIAAKYYDQSIVEMFKAGLRRGYSIAGPVHKFSAVTP